MFGFTICLMVFSGPLFFNKANEADVHQQSSKYLKHLSLRQAFQGSNTDKYAKLELITGDGDSLNMLFYIPENEHKKLLSFLQQNKIINQGRLKNVLPIELEEDKLSDFGPVTFMKSGAVIEYLKIGEKTLIGNKPSIGTKLFLYFLGILFPLIGLLGFLLSISLFIGAYKIYLKSNLWPDLPNMFEESMKGWKAIFGRSEAKQKNK